MIKDHETRDFEMSLDLVSRELYGGAITVDLPIDVIDASDLRQIPDHQEVFLSDKTLSSIIFEINQYQQVDLVFTPNTDSNIDNDNSNSTNGASDSPSAPNIQASLHHLEDTISPPDHLVPDSIRTTTVKLSRPSLSSCPAYTTTATIITPEIDRSQRSTLPLAWQSDPAQTQHQVKVTQLLVRLRQYDTDICVRVNVPLREFEGDAAGESGQRERREEERRAEEVVEGIVRSLDVRDFGLFGGE